MPSEYGTCRTVKVRIWPWLSGENPQNILSCSLFARQRTCSKLLYRKVQWFRGGLVVKAHIILHHSFLGSRVIKKIREDLLEELAVGDFVLDDRRLVQHRFDRLRRPPGVGQIAFFRTLICTSARRNPTTCGTNQGN